MCEYENIAFKIYKVTPKPRVATSQQKKIKFLSHFPLLYTKVMCCSLFSQSGNPVNKNSVYSAKTGVEK